ncbi:MAG: carcinine hydrolase/isopenicillin-N N-acyltransferase family protein [Candidatus Thorarchaeota archaeon]
MPSFSGAVILPELSKTLLFKNRDLIAEAHSDLLFYDVDCFGIRGIDAVTEQITGLAIGVNRYGLVASNTHVRNTIDPSYHILTEQVLMFARDADDALSMVIDVLRKGRTFQWGNLILADHDSMLVIELEGSEHSIEWSERKVLRTSHHIILDTEDTVRADIETGTMYETSVQRVERGYDLIREIKSVPDVFSLLKDHGDSKNQASLCRHPDSTGELSTAMSYVVEIDHPTETTRPKIVFHVAQGNPCTSEYRAVPIVFPADEGIVKRATEIYFK